MTHGPDREWQQRFDAFASRKTRAAIGARLWPFATVEAPAAPMQQPIIGNTWSRTLFDGPFYLSPSSDGRRPACSLVFVQSSDGNTAAEDPAALGGGVTDTHLIYEGLSRVAADAVMAGAATVRGADVVFSVWHPEMVALRATLGLTRHPVQIVVTRHGLNVKDELCCNIPSIPVALLTGTRPSPEAIAALRDRPWITHVPVVDGDYAAAFEQLRSNGIRRISCVGGRTVARALLEAGLIDDVHLTTAPVAGGEPGTPIAPWPWRGRVLVRKHGSGPESGVVFEQIVPQRRGVDSRRRVSP
jgi:riboflavin biosynthesis pyrimidine reductase